MSPDAPQPYEVRLSGRVFDKVRELAAVAKSRGDGEAFLAALREFGDPLIDLRHAVGQIRLGIVPPLAMRYVVLEERRQVFVAALPVLMPKSPLDDSAGAESGAPPDPAT